MFRGRPLPLPWTERDVTPQPRVPTGGATTSPSVTGARITGVDLARALAIIGMFAVHIGPTEADGALGYAYALPHGRASMLFVLVAGVGVSLLAASPSGSPRRTTVTLLWRAALLLPVGLALQELDHDVAVILQDYALLFLVAIVLLPLGGRALLAVIALAAPLGSAAYLWGQLRAPEVFQREPVGLTDPAVEVGHRLFLSGPYPLLTWLAPFVLGLWLGRLDLRSRRVRRRLLLWGTVVAAASTALSSALVAVLGDPGDPTGWDHLVVDAAHSQMPLWLTGATAAATAVLGGSLLVADRLPRVSHPLVLTGQLALTAYVGHLVVLGLGPEALTSSQVGPAATRLAGFTLVTVGLATAWRRAWSRGPLEMLLQVPGSRRSGAADAGEARSSQTPAGE